MLGKIDHTTTVLGVNTAQLDEWLWISQLQTDFLIYICSHDELGYDHSYTQYLQGFHLCDGSPYIAKFSASLHMF